MGVFYHSLDLDHVKVSRYQTSKELIAFHANKKEVKNQYLRWNISSERRDKI